MGPEALPCCSVNLVPDRPSCARMEGFEGLDRWRNPARSVNPIYVHAEMG